MTNKFEVGNKVRSVAYPTFDMVIIDFAVEWENNLPKKVAGEKNPDYPICRYYNIHTNKWEKEKFQSCELEISGEEEKS